MAEDPHPKIGSEMAAIVLARGSLASRAAAYQSLLDTLNKPPDGLVGDDRQLDELTKQLAAVNEQQGLPGGGYALPDTRLERLRQLVDDTFAGARAEQHPRKK